MAKKQKKQGALTSPCIVCGERSQATYAHLCERCINLKNAEYRERAWQEHLKKLYPEEKS